MLAKIVQETERNGGNIKKSCEPFAMFVTVCICSKISQIRFDQIF